MLLLAATICVGIGEKICYKREAAYYHGSQLDWKFPGNRDRGRQPDRNPLERQPSDQFSKPFPASENSRACDSEFFSYAAATWDRLGNEQLAGQYFVLIASVLLCIAFICFTILPYNGKRLPIPVSSSQFQRQIDTNWGTHKLLVH